MTQPDWAVKKVAKARYAGKDDWGILIVSQESAAKLLRQERRRCVRAVKRVKATASHPYNHWMQAGYVSAIDDALAAIGGKS